MKRIMTILCLTALAVFLLSGCQMLTYNYQDDVLEYAMITDSDDLSKLDEYPNLEYVDLRGSTCYEAILNYVKTHPNVTVRYNISFGDKRYDASATEISLNGYETEFDLLLQNLQYLPQLKQVHLNQVTFTRAQMDELIGKYPNVTFSYTVELSGRHYDNTVEELDLSHLSSKELDEASHAISLLPQLRQVNLVNQVSEGRLSIEDVARLNEACPGVLFNYEFFLFGQKVSTMSETLLFDSVKIGNEGIDQLRSAFAILEQCTSVRLDSCGIDNEVAAQLRSEYPELNISWRIFAGRYSMMTDEEMVRMPNNLTNQEAELLKYCTNVKYMDLQGSKVYTIDFINYMPKLECLVLTSTKVSDITPLSNCPNLTWLEVSGCPIKDLSPLSSLKNLKFLNITNTVVSELDPLDEVPLERINCVKSYVSTAELQEFSEKHDACEVVNTGNTVGHGWRYQDRRLTEPYPYYAQMIEIFRYNERGYTGNRKEN